MDKEQMYLVSGESLLRFKLDLTNAYVDAQRKAKDAQVQIAAYLEAAIRRLEGDEAPDYETPQTELIEFAVQMSAVTTLGASLDRLEKLIEEAELVE